MNTATQIHKFEQAGLGQSPFRVIRCDKLAYKPHPDAPAQPGGTCDYCGMGIMYVFRIRSADKREFNVGSDCVMKTGDSGLANPVKKEVNRHKREAQHARQDAIIEEGKALLEQAKASLEARPHPYRFEGKTMFDYVDWQFAYAGRSGKVQAAKIVKKHASE